MENDKIQTFLLIKGKFIPDTSIAYVSSKLQSLQNEISIFRIYSLTLKNPLTFTLLYWLVPGFAIIDRVLLKKGFISYLKIFFLPIFYVAFKINLDIRELQEALGLLVLYLYIGWIIADGFTIYNRVKVTNLSILLSIIDR